MAYSEKYRKQVQLLMRCIPYVAKQECFALKGGTAINLFHRDMPRLSVDIDLTYLPDSERDQALQEVESALKEIATQIKGADQDIEITESSPGSQESTSRLVIRSRDGVQVKIETSPVLRRCVYEPKNSRVSSKVEDEFGFAEMKVLSFADLYAGKIMAALDRQHPRDLFDVQLLLNNEGIDERLRKALLVYLISHGRPPHELLNPQLKDIKQEYEVNFVGMTKELVSLEGLLHARDSLIKNVVEGIAEEQKDFLLSFFSGNPNWDKLGINDINTLPAVKWKLLNINKIAEAKKLQLVEELESVLK